MVDLGYPNSLNPGGTQQRGTSGLEELVSAEGHPSTALALKGEHVIRAHFLDLFGAITATSIPWENHLLAYSDFMVIQGDHFPIHAGHENGGKASLPL